MLRRVYLSTHMRVEAQVTLCARQSDSGSGTNTTWPETFLGVLIGSQANLLTSVSTVSAAGVSTAPPGR